MSPALVLRFAPQAAALGVAAVLGWRAHDLASSGAEDSARRMGWESGASYARALCALESRRADLSAEESAHELRRRMGSLRPDPDALLERLRDGSFFAAPSADAPSARLP